MDAKSKPRRRHSAQFKAEVIAAWVGPEFVALSLPAPASCAPPLAASSQGIRIEFKRGSTTVGVSWPVTAAAECGLWLRVLLRVDSR